MRLWEADPFILMKNSEQFSERASIEEGSQFEYPEVTEIKKEAVVLRESWLIRLLKMLHQMTLNPKGNPESPYKSR